MSDMSVAKISTRRKPSMDLTGQRFGYWVVLCDGASRRTPPTKNRPQGRYCRYWRCRCQLCGTIRDVFHRSLTNEKSRNCGCKRYTRNGLWGSSIFNMWRGMKQRCSYPKDKEYNRYGGRGIMVCTRWADSFENFLADMGHPPSNKHTLDRIDNDGDYCSENCRWSTRREQANNRRNNHYLRHEGITMTIAQWALAMDVPAGRLSDRLKRNWSIERTLTEEVHRKVGGWDG